MQHLVEHRVLVGDVVVDAIGAAEDKREELVGREILLLLKLVMAAVMVLCVLCFIVVMKK